MISADVYIGKRNALEELDKGTREISIGYDFYLDRQALATKGPLITNHVALVPKGRAGPTVRVLDEVPDYDFSESTDPGESDVDKADVMDAVSTAVDAAMKRMKFDADGQDAMKKTFMDALGTALDEALTPVADELKTIKEGQDAAAKAADAAQKAADEAAAKAAADEKAEKAADELVAQVRKDERERYRILDAAAPLIPDEVRPTLAEADVKTILVTAVGDFVEDAEKRTVDYLQGALDSAIAAAKDNGGAPAPGGAGASNVLPFGVSAFDTARSGSGSGDPRVKAQDEQIQKYRDLYKDAGGI